MKMRKEIIALATLFLIETRVASAINPGEFDNDDNHVLSSDERKELRNAAKAENTFKSASIRLQLDTLEEKYRSTGNVPLVEFTVPPDEDECSFEQRIFLRADVSGIPLSLCSEYRPGSNAALLSLSVNRVTDTTTAILKGGIGVALVPAGTISPSETDGFRITDLAVLGYVEADAQSRSGATSGEYMRTGLKTEMLFEGGDLVDHVGASLVGYYQSDLGFDGSGYGATFSLVPQALDKRLNGYTVNPKAKSEFYWIASGSIDAFHIDEPGRTKLTSGEDYLWIGGKAGFNYTDKSFLENGVSLEATVQADLNVLNGDSAVLFGSSLNFHLDKAKRASLSFTYNRGETRKDLQFQDKFTAGLKLKF